MNEQEILDRFKQHRMTEDPQESSTMIRSSAIELAILINLATPDSREKSLAITHLEEAVMWANKALALHPE
jgi:hypothetical protein